MAANSTAVISEPVLASSAKAEVWAGVFIDSMVIMIPN